MYCATNTYVQVPAQPVVVLQVRVRTCLVQRPHFCQAPQAFHTGAGQVVVVAFVVDLVVVAVVVVGAFVVVEVVVVVEAVVVDTAFTEKCHLISYKCARSGL